MRLTIRQWRNVMFSLAVGALYILSINLFKLSPLELGVTLAIVTIIEGILLYSCRSTLDLDIIKRTITNDNQSKKSSLEDNYIIMTETSQCPINHLSSLVEENYTKEELKNLFNYVDTWKKENHFTWNSYNLYDRLNVFADYKDDKIEYSISFSKHTKRFKIKGQIKRVTESPTMDTYMIAGIVLRLSNVQTADLDKEGVWTISVNENIPNIQGILVKFDERGEYKDGYR